MSTQEMSLKEWIVIFYPTTGAARLCPTVDFARKAVTSDATFYKHVYKSAADFRSRHDHLTLEKCWIELHKLVSWRFPKTAIGKIEDYSQEPPDVDTETFSKMLWDFIQDVGDRLAAPQMSGTKSTTKENYELKLADMQKLMEDGDAYKEQYNNQARIVFSSLYNYGKQFLNEDEIKKLILSLVVERKLKTKQDPWVIFQYYRPQFIKDGFIIRGRAKKSRAE